MAPSSSKAAGGKKLVEWLKIGDVMWLHGAASAFFGGQFGVALLVPATRELLMDTFIKIGWTDAEKALLAFLIPIVIGFGGFEMEAGRVAKSNPALGQKFGKWFVGYHIPLVAAYWVNFNLPCVGPLYKFGTFLASSLGVAAALSLA